MSRITRQDVYARVAEVFALRGTCQRLQVGCVAVNDGRIIATGYNGSLKTDRFFEQGKCSCDITKPCQKAIHAEANLISYSAKNGIALKDTILYVTHSPCLKCAELIIQSGIKEVYYGEEFRDDAGLKFLNDNGVPTCKYEKQQV